MDFGGQRLHTLGYADDAALLDGSIDMASTRVTAIAAGSRKDADMTINIAKTKVMHVGAQDEVTPTTETEAKEICTFVCKNVGCDWVFHNAHGAKCHQGKCRYRDHWEADRLMERRWEDGENRWEYRVR